MQHGQLLRSWDWAENTDTDFLTLKEMASRLDSPGNENVLKSDLCVLQKLEQYFALPFSLTGKTIDKKSRNVYVDEYILCFTVVNNNLHYANLLSQPRPQVRLFFFSFAQRRKIFEKPQNPP